MSLVVIYFFLHNFCSQVDIPLSIPFYKWLLGEECTLSTNDMQYIDSTFAKSLRQMEALAQIKLASVS